MTCCPEIPNYGYKRFSLYLVLGIAYSLQMPYFCIIRFNELVSHNYVTTFRAYLNFVQLSFESSFSGCFFIFMKSIAGYVTDRKRKTDRKETEESTGAFLASLSDMPDVWLLHAGLHKFTFSSGLLVDGR